MQEGISGLSMSSTLFTMNLPTLSYLVKSGLVSFMDATTPETREVKIKVKVRFICDLYTPRIHADMF